MGSKCEDHMDLGGFLQTYVLGNPFQSPSVTIPNPDTEETKNINLSQPESISTSQPSPPTDTPGRLQRVNSPIIVEPVEENDDTSAESPLSASAKRTVGEIDENVTSSTKLVMPSPENASSLGHIGSNATYATLLRKRKVADVHRPCQIWLQENYAFSASLPNTPFCMYSNAILLREVQAIFANITSIVLSRIVKFTFPGCGKMVNKTGTFWQNLVRKPQACTSAHVAAAINTQQGEEWDSAFFRQGFSASSDDSIIVSSLIYWSDLEGRRVDLVKLEQQCSLPDTQSIINPMSYLLGNDVLYSSAKRRKQSPKFDPEVYLPCDDVNDEDYDPKNGSDSIGTSRVGGGRKRKKSRPIKHTMKATSDEENIISLGASNQLNDSTTDSCLTDGRSSLRARSMSPLRLANDNRAHDNEDSSNDMNSASCPPLYEINSIEKVIGSICKVKEEPIEKEFIGVEAHPIERDPDQLDRDASLRNILNSGENSFVPCDENENCDIELISSVDSQENPAEDDQHYLAALKENTSLKSSIRSLKSKLIISQNQVKTALTGLAKSQEEIASLKKVVAEKDDQLYELVREFSDLNENFKRFGQKFQTLLLASEHVSGNIDSVCNISNPSR